ncbi:MAG: hypothetical protein NTX56_20410 [Proteobacteria bacterium]|nr:hypothetical protein [Pseudomonadota bacterium]
MKKVFANLLLLLISCAIGLALCELALRGYLYIRDTHRSFDLVITSYDKSPGSKGFRFQFDPENNFQFKGDVRYNNWGYRSDFDWSEDKASGEFRIAVFGDSYTECEPNDYSWVDVLHKKLSANSALLKLINRKKITVANFGRSGAGFQRFSQEYMSVRERFKPDLTVFAFIDEDFERLVVPVGALRTSRSSEIKQDLEHFLKIPGFGGNLYAVPSGPNIFVRSLYYASNDYGLLYDKDSLRNAKRFLATTVAREKYLKSGTCELCEFVKSALGSKLQSVLAPKVVSDQANDVFLKAAYESIDLVGPEPILLVNLPTYYETVNQWSKTGPLRAPKYFPQAALQNGALRIVPLADFLPKSASYEEKYSWFTLPWDGHPANPGADLFGSTLAKLLGDYLEYSLSGVGKPYMFLTQTRAKELMLAAGETKEREAKEVKAYPILEIARKKRGEKKYEESLELFSQVLQLAPQIGTPGLLYVERGDIYQTVGRSQEALDDYARAIAINPFQSFLIRHASVAYSLGKRDLVAEDIKQLEACCSNEADVKQLMQQLRPAN